MPHLPLQLAPTQFPPAASASVCVTRHMHANKLGGSGPLTAVSSDFNFNKNVNFKRQAAAA